MADKSDKKKKHSALEKRGFDKKSLKNNGILVPSRRPCNSSKKRESEDKQEETNHIFK